MLNKIYQYDLRLLLWCRKSANSAGYITLVRAISKSGDGYMQVVLPAICALLIPVVGEQFLLLALKSFLIERILYFFLKHTLKRRRPPEIVPLFSSIITASDKFSFPSGHTMAAFLLAGLSVSVLGGHAYPIYLWAIAVGSSRVILGVHFPTDILAGALIGTLIANMVIYL
ncbi:phosphatase PAP2 family protein [Thalassotalea sp. PLHSN55]|uniref:phosphatase PAP2 family protein n=1 Tax=Thalassotalea sp. PLHSN55 TaxID=3435888 RepID=UPI003F84F903